MSPAPLFPLSPREVYRRHTLHEVVCQFRFPSILRIGAESPAPFQERIRKLYPQYGQDIPGQPPRAIQELIERLSIPGMPFSESHRFSTLDKLHAVTLTPDSWAVSSRSYEGWESFLERVLFVQQEFSQEYKPAAYLRIGLRYVDRIVRSKLNLDRVGWRNLLNSELAGFLGSDDFSDWVDEIKTQVDFRLPDMKDSRLRLIHGLQRMPGTGEPSYVIDADLFTIGSITADDATQILQQFHSTAGNLFRWATKGQLREALEPVTNANRGTGS